MRRGSARTRFFVMVGVMLSYVAVLILLPLAIPFDVNATELSASLTPPGSEGHVIGCDSMGRDVLARTLAGGSESVLLGLAIMAVAVLVGCAVGLAAGFFGGAVDYVLSRVITAFQAFPSFVLAVAIAGILGQGTINMIIAIAAVYWTQYARLTRSIAIAFKQSECVSAARMCGARAGALMMRYFVPEMAGQVAVLSAVSMSDIVLTMAGLSFIGLGPARPTNEWGAMMSEAQATFQYALWCMLVPMAALFITVVLVNLLGDTLRDALDVRTQAVSKRRFLRRRDKSANSEQGTSAVRSECLSGKQGKHEDEERK